MMKLTEDIISYLTDESKKRLTIVYDVRGFLLRTDVSYALEEYGKVGIRTGSLLDLRLAYESLPDKPFHGRLVYVLRDRSLEIMPDIREHAHVISEFRLENYFRWYDLDTLLTKNFDELEYCYRHPASYRLTAQDTDARVEEYRQSPEYKGNIIKAILGQWNSLFAAPIFTDFSWIPKAADILHQAIETGCYDLFEEHVDRINDYFQPYIRANYASIINSSCPSKGAPRVVSQVLPFIHKQPDAKKALIVVDGMNIWQGEMLAKALADLDCAQVTRTYTYSWLPSVTELSRQAIFRGEAPQEMYAQSPASEDKIFREFFVHRQVDKSAVQYTYNSYDKPSYATRWLGCVDMTLDHAMHSAKNNGYLLDDTARWLTEGIVDYVRELVLAGFSVYVTSDHGNIYTAPYKKLKQYEKVGSDGTTRHITLAKEANKDIFRNEHRDYVMQVDEDSSTFYPCNHLAFDNERHIAHGGPHWLEMIVPFINVKLR